MKDSSDKPVLTLPRLGLHFYAVATTLVTWVLVWVGGLVTSKDAGMSVPDWPTSFGYNMFLLPISQWTGGVLYEHTHRLLGMTLGLLTVGLMILLFSLEKRIWVKRLGGIAFFMVVIQGVLGGQRVVQANPFLGFVHGCFAQICLAVFASIALFTSPWWERVTQLGDRQETIRPGWIRHVTLVTVLIFLQLMLGAAMRHAHSGLSIPDFPTAYGSWWPHVTPGQLDGINLDRVARHEMPTTMAQIHLQMVHRLMAALILLAILSSTGMLLPKENLNGWLKVWNAVWLISVLFQVFLGAWTIWSRKAADVATAHVAIGAFLLTAGVIQVLMARRVNDVVAVSSRPELSDGSRIR